jgi:lipoate-protein ligase A
MNLYDLGHVPWLESQLIYHALPRLGVEGLLLVAPAEPYVCIGYHQDADQEVDLAYCRDHDLPVFRREVGGGAVYLDGEQMFYQLVIHRDNPLYTGNKTEFYERFLAPVVQAYMDLGVETRYRPVNDIVTKEGRKISGTGAGDIGDCAILVGNLIADFDYATMVRVLRVPDAKFRDKVFASLRQNLTTIRRETGRMPPWDEMADALVRSFESALGPLARAILPEAVHKKAEELAKTHTTDEWLLRSGRRPGEGREVGGSRDVKIASGVHVVHRMHKAPGGLIRATFEIQEGRLRTVTLSGDFFFYPAEKLADLERHLAGVALERVPSSIESFFSAHSIQAPGVTPTDLAQALGVPEAQS